MIALALRHEPGKGGAVFAVFWAGCPCSATVTSGLRMVWIARRNSQRGWPEPWPIRPSCWRNLNWLAARGADGDRACRLRAGGDDQHRVARPDLGGGQVMRSPSWSWPCRFWYADHPALGALGILWNLRGGCGGTDIGGLIQPDAHSAAEAVAASEPEQEPGRDSPGGLLPRMLAGFLLGLVARLWGTASAHSTCGP